ncbi:MAG TPA: tetratricopeptide repeat protein [Candidatus Anaerobiospirillum stercoravium]|nr:tetratricopeptide repeat protein [Candidatus Anaerobiospirillum stercoravium]
MLVSQENLEQVLQSSLQKPLFCFFYDESAECQGPKNAVTTAISDTNEYVSLGLFPLTDRACLMVAGQIGLQQVPTLVVVDQGQPVAMLEGNEIVTGLQELLNKFMPSQADLLMREALQAEAVGDLSAAVTKAGQAYGMDESNLKFKFIYARLLIAQKNLKQAHALLDDAGREEKASAEYQQLISALTIAEQAQNSPELMELERKYQQDPSDENAIAYAVALAEAGRKDEALELLFAKLKQDLSKDEVKKTFLDILSTMNGDKLQSQYRRKLYTLMY